MPHLGESIIRIDARAKVTGDAAYPGDINMPGQLWMEKLFASRAHTRTWRWLTAKERGRADSDGTLERRNKMRTTLKDLSTEQVEQLIERTIDRRLQVWLEQVLDALTVSDDEDEAALRAEFAESLRRSLAQARAGEGTDLKTFREQIAR